MARKSIYHGLEEDKLVGMSMDEYTKVTTSRLRRTLKRLKTNPRLKDFILKVRQIKEKNPKKVIKTHLRDAVILPEWLGLKFGVHNGKEFKMVDITVDRVGFRLGGFSHTTTRALHSGPGIGATR